MKKLPLKPDLALNCRFSQSHQGIVDDWEASRTCSGDDGLSTSNESMLGCISHGELKLSSDEINRIGYTKIPDSQNQRLTKWLPCTSDKGKDEQATELLIGALDNSIDIVQLSPVLENLMSDKVEQWLNEQVKNLDEGSLSYIVGKTLFHYHQKIVQ